MEPKIRYNGYTNKWDDVCLNDIVSTAGIKNRENLPLVSFSITNDQGFVPQDDKFENGGTMRDANKSMYYIVSPKTFAYNPARINVGSIGYYDLEKDVIISSLYVVFKTDQEKCDDYYFLQWFKSDKFKRLIEQYQEGGVRLYFFYDKLCKCHVHIPSKEEQHKISSYFRVLDFKLQASAKKVDSLKKLKSASLVTMFPQNGKSTPKVRFKGFEGEWDKQSASDLFLTIDERNRPELPVLSACQDVRGMIPRDKIGFNVSHDTSNEVTYKRVQPGQFVIHLRSFQGGFAHSSYDGIISPAYTVFDFKNKEQHDDYYWKIVFMSRSFIERLRLITYGIRDGRSISFNEFKELSFLFPSKEEQHAIATFFRSLDRKIALETARLEKLKQIKLACLDKMFV